MRSGQIVVVSLLVLCLLAGAVTGSQLYYRLSYLWGILWAGSWVWSRLSLKDIRFQRVSRAQRAQVGQIFEERFEIKNLGRWPHPMLVVRNESPLPDSQGSRVFPMIEGNRSRSYVARTRLMQRGVFPLGPTILESGDLFGLFPSSKVLPANDSLMVYPMMVEVTAFPNPTGILPGGDALRRRTSQVTANASGVREYAPGDPLNRIHWLSTARRGRLIAKEFELDPLAEVWIFLDAASSVQASVLSEVATRERVDLWSQTTNIPLTPSTEEYGVSIAASLARYYLRQGRTVGFAGAGQSLSVLSPERGGRQLGKILESLAMLRAEGEIPLRGLVELQARHIPRGSTVILITASVEQEVAVGVDFLLRRGLRPVMVLINAASFSGNLCASTNIHGQSGTEQLVETMKMWNVPVRRIDRGVDLTVALESGFG